MVEMEVGKLYESEHNRGMVALAVEITRQQVSPSDPVVRVVQMVGAELWFNYYYSEQDPWSRTWREVSCVA